MKPYPSMSYKCINISSSLEFLVTFSLPIKV